MFIPEVKSNPTDKYPKKKTKNQGKTKKGINRERGKRERSEVKKCRGARRTAP